MITYSGAIVTIENEESPTIVDMAVHLGQIPRFGGACRTWWTVLHHVLACEEFVWEYFATASIDFKEQLAMHVLLHDAHEAITMDVPKTWKTEEVKRQQENLDRRIYKHLGLELPDERFKSCIKFVDLVMLAAEAVTVGPAKINEPQYKDYIDSVFPMTYLKDEQIGTAAQATVMGIRDSYARPFHTTGERSVAVMDFQLILNKYLRTYSKQGTANIAASSV